MIRAAAGVSRGSLGLVLGSFRMVGGGARVNLGAMTTTAPTSETPSAPPGPRRFLRSRSDRVLGGVCGGLGEYFAVDPMLFRIGTVALAVVGGFSSSPTRSCGSSSRATTALGTRSRSPSGDSSAGATASRRASAALR